MFLAKIKKGGQLLADIPLEKASIRFALNEVGSFDFSLPVSFLSARELPLQDDIPVADQEIYEAQIYEDGELFVQGTVDSIKLDFIASELVYAFQCNAELGELAIKRARSNAKYQDQQVLGILVDLLKSVSTWKLGDISTIVDATVRTTIDLRNERHLLPQIKKLLEATPDMFFRYGGFINGFHRLDVGKFDVNRTPKIAPHQISDLVQNMKYSTVTRQVEAYGGEITQIGVKRLINLDDALAYDPTLATDPDFPIQTDNGAKVVTNAALSIGDESIETFSEIVPTDREDPLAADIEAAGYALYLKTKAYLLQRQQFESDWTTAVEEIPALLKVGDRAFLSANAKQAYFDPLTRQSIYNPIGAVAKWFRVNGYNVSIDRNKVDYKLNVAANARLASGDYIVELYESIEQPDKASGVDNSLVVGTYDILSAVVPLGLSANTVNGELGEYPGVLYTIPFGTIPGGATVVTVYDVPFSTTPDVTFRISAYPVLPSTPIQVAVSYQKNWLPTYTVPIYVLVEYT